jgi:hypothetical protein
MCLFTVVPDDDGARAAPPSAPPMPRRAGVLAQLDDGYLRVVVVVVGACACLVLM